MNRIVYDIVNPSDACTMVAVDRVIAAAAILLLGRGSYGLNPLKGAKENEGVPVFLLQGDAALPWFEASFGAQLSTILTTRGAEIADALESVVYGDQHDRQTYEDAMELITDAANRTTWRDRYENGRRTSILNQICQGAWQMAARLRANPPEERA